MFLHQAEHDHKEEKQSFAPTNLYILNLLFQTYDPFPILDNVLRKKYMEKESEWR